jgi:hypothetical protein
MHEMPDTWSEFIRPLTDSLLCIFCLCVCCCATCCCRHSNPSTGPSQAETVDHFTIGGQTPLVLHVLALVASRVLVAGWLRAVIIWEAYADCC